MAYRWCETGEKWLETFEYTVSDSGETICPEHEEAVVGYIGGPFPSALSAASLPSEEAREEAFARGLVERR